MAGIAMPRNLSSTSDDRGDEGRHGTIEQDRTGRGRGTRARPWHARATPGVARTSHGRISRSEHAKREFRKSHACPSTGKMSGACPGYVIDHISPLKRGGADAPYNMQWQTIEAAFSHRPALPRRTYVLSRRIAENECSAIYVCVGSKSKRSCF